VTGARPRHVTTTDPYKLQAAIFNNTAPSINTRVSLHTIRDVSVIAIEVDAYPGVCATTDGRCLRRVQGAHGPECRPYLPHEHIRRRSDLGLVDYSAQIVDKTTWADYDPLEVERLRQTIERRRGDLELLSLAPPELIRALRLVETREDALIPNIAGLLLVGREEVLRRVLPTHGVAFQVVDAQGNVMVNDWFYGPLIKTLEAIEQRFSARNQEKEIQVGFLRVPIPDYAPEAFREAVLNAVLHRDYARLGAVHIQFHADHLFITNPGGFLEGITLDNLLVHEPTPRNPRLAEAFRRIGMVETTGRGIDKIYRGQLWYGRPLPDYTGSDSEGVRLILRGGDTNLKFAAFVNEQDKAGAPLELDELLILNHLQHERSVDVPTIGHLTQRGPAYARSILERLVEHGLVEPRGEKRGRVYHLSATLYRQLEVPAGYVRAHGFDPIRQEAMVLEYVKAHGRITRREASELCNLNSNQAKHLLRRLANENRLRLRGSKRGAFYEGL
jgi:ATP-dependent DNA helicase RecG